MVIVIDGGVDGDGDGDGGVDAKPSQLWWWWMVMVVLKPNHHNQHIPLLQPSPKLLQSKPDQTQTIFITIFMITTMIVILPNKLWLLLTSSQKSPNKWRSDWDQPSILHILWGSPASSSGLMIRAPLGPVDGDGDGDVGDVDDVGDVGDVDVLLDLAALNI